MGLLVADHLQPVLDAAQEKIGLGQVACRLFRDPASFGESFKRRDGAAAAELWVATSGDELLGLGEELDIADAAAAELDVVPFDRDGAVALIGMNAPLHCVDVGDGRVVEIFAPDERRELAEELRAQRDIARGDARQFWPKLS